MIGVLSERFRAVRAASLQLAAPLSAEDQCVQSMPEASPTKWHLAHTTWFLEAMVLQPHGRGYRSFDSRYAELFNSYYEALGPRHAREARGLLTRPALDDVLRFRRHVDDAMAQLIEAGPLDARLTSLIELGLNHEQQHQELMLTDIKHAFYMNPLRPAYGPRTKAAPDASEPLKWNSFPAGLRQIGDAGDRFAFDNERPRHTVHVGPFQLATRAATCGELLEFILDGGYQRPELWLSDGWAIVRKRGWEAPLYWEPDARASFKMFTLYGMEPLNPHEPACHLSFYEACAFAEWAGARLPTEFEWETAAAGGSNGSIGQSAAVSASDREPICGSPSVWQWTRSSYDPYPGFRPEAGLAAEYNGKFMVGQLVLRGGSCATPPGHVRITYRNFFPPEARWQFSGVRLARDA
jgi:ergothioneine biosynthesis protein EgtB